MLDNTIFQLYSLGIYFIFGILISVIFDIFRVFRRTFKTNNFITYIEDMLFWIITGILLIYLLIVISNGVIRFYNIIGLFIRSNYLYSLF